MKSLTFHHSLALVIFALFALPVPPAFSAIVTWNNTGTDFNTGTSWDGGTAPGASDRAVFFSTATNQPSVTADITVSGLTFDNTGSGAGYTLSGTAGEKLTLTSTTSDTNAAIFTTNTTGTNTISTDLYFGNTSGTIFNIQSNASTLVISGNISSAAGGNGFRMQQAAGAVTTLTGSNSYAGNTTVVGGQLNINNAWAISTGNLIAGGTLYIDNTSGAGITLQNNDLHLQGSTLTFLGSSDLNFGSGSLRVVSADRTVSISAGTVTFGSLDASATNLVITKTGVGTLAITGAAEANYQGGFTLNKGLLLIGNKAALGTGLFNITGSSSLEASTDLSGANAVTNTITLGNNFTLGGSNKLTLSGTITMSGSDRFLYNNNTETTELTGPIYLSESSGTGRTLTLSGSNSLTIRGAIANYNGGSGTAGNLVVSGSTSRTVSLTGTNSSYTGITTVNQSVTLEVAKLANGGTNSSIGASTSAKENLILNRGSTLRYIGTGDSTDRLFTMAGISSGNVFTLEASGTGAIQFTGTGSLGYGTADQSRTLNLGGTNTSTNIFAITIGDNGTGLTRLVKLDAGTWILTGDNTYTGSTLINGGTLQVGNGGTSGTLGAGTDSITNNALLIFNRSDNFTLDNLIRGTGALIQAGTSTTTLTANNSYTGGTLISSGTLLITTGARAGTGIITNNSVLAFNNTSTLNVSGGITGSGSLQHIGSALLILTSDNDYSGGTLVNGATLRFGNNSSPTGSGGSGEITFSNNGVLQVDRGDTFTLANLMSGTGGLRQVGSGTTILTANNTFSGSTIMTKGTLQLGDGGSSGSVGTNNIALNDYTLIVNRSDSYTMGNQISGSNSATFVQAGSGTTTLTGNNSSFLGSASITGGTLELNSSGGTSLSSAASVSVAGGTTLLVSKSNQVSDSAAVTLSGGTIRRASGVSETFGALTVSSASYLDYDSGSTGTLRFGSYTPSSLLTVNNFLEGNKLVFGTDLTTSVTNASYFAFDNGFTSSWDGGAGLFTITAIPEPSTYAVAAGLIALMLWPLRRRKS